MRVAVDVSFLGAHRGGDETFATGLVAGLASRRGPEDSFPLLVAPSAVPLPVADDPAFPVVPTRRRTGLWHHAVTLPAVLARLRPLDLAVSVTHAPLVGPPGSVLVLGDLSFLHRPGDYPAATARRLRTLVPLHVARARAVLVPSEFTRQDVLESYAVPPHRVHVVPNRVLRATVPDDAVARQEAAGLLARGVRPPYLLYLGNLHPRKNVPALIRAFRAARQDAPHLREHRLVVAGAPWFGSRAEELAAEDDPDVVLLGRVSDAARSLLLDAADALAYVSLFEGFGLPPLEGMAHGVPVLASRVTSLPEVCGNAALLVDPADPEAVADGLRRVLTDDRLRTRLRVAGPERAAGFDTDRVGDAAMAALRAAIGTPDGRRGHDRSAPPPRRESSA